jgi:hypothetical protein
MTLLNYFSLENHMEKVHGTVHESTDSSLNGSRWSVDQRPGFARPKGYEDV